MRRPSLPTSISILALVVAFVAAAPQAEAVVRVAFAGNAGRLQGRTLSQVRSRINAARLGGRTLAQVRANVDATRISGLDVHQVRSNINATALAGVGPSGYVHGRAKVVAGRLVEPDNTGSIVVVALPGGMGVEMSCGSGDLRIFVRNQTGEIAQMSVLFNDGLATSLTLYHKLTANSGVYAGFDKAITQGTAVIETGTAVITATFNASATATQGCEAGAQIVSATTS